MADTRDGAGTQGEELERLRRRVAELRAMDPGVRAIVCSGYAHDGVMAQCESHGFRGVVTKPYTVEQLDAALRRVLAARE